MSGFPRQGPDSAWRVAARYGDADAEELGLLEAIRKQGIDIEEFQHVADQRALRVVLQQRPGHDPRGLLGLLPTPVQLAPHESALHLILTAAYFDGLYIGWRAARLSGDTAEEGE